MNFAKKSISVVLAGLMAASSLFVGTTAFAAPTYTPITASTDQAYAANPVMEKTDKDGFVDFGYGNYYSFTPETTGTYILKVDSDPMYKKYDSTLEKYVYSPTYFEGSYRCDAYECDDDYYYGNGANVCIYEDVDMNEQVAHAAPELYNRAYTYSEATDSVVNDDANMVYNSGITSVTLLAGKTYYIKADASHSNVNTEYKYNEATDKYELKSYTHDYIGTARFSITPSDWDISVGALTDSVKVTVPADYSEDGYVYRRVFKQLETNAVYTGVSPVAVVPENILGYAVTDVIGTDNKNITSLTLSSTVKDVSGFSDLKNLAWVNLANAENIYSAAFANDTALKSVAIPSTVKYIGESAFVNDTALSSVTLNYGLKEIGSYAFYNTALKGAVVPDSVNSIGSYALGYVENLDTNTVAPYDTTEVVAAGFAMGAYSNDVAYFYGAQNGIACYNVTAGCPHPYNVTTVEATLFNNGTKTSVCPLCGNTTKSILKKKTFKIKSLKAGKNAFSIKASAKGVTGYQVQYSTSKKFSKKTTKTVNVKTTKSLSKTIKGLKKGKKYYVRVRATGVNAQGKTAYSKYTSVKSVKVK